MVLHHLCFRIKNFYVLIIRVSIIKFYLKIIYNEVDKTADQRPFCMTIAFSIKGRSLSSLLDQIDVLSTSRNRAINRATSKVLQATRDNTRLSLP